MKCFSSLSIILFLFKIVEKSFKRRVCHLAEPNLENVNKLVKCFKKIINQILSGENYFFLQQ